MVRNIVCLVCAACLLGCVGFAQEPAPAPEIIFFYSPSCHDCHEIRETVLTVLQQKYQGRITVAFYDINDIENFKKLVELKQQCGRTQGSVPVVFFNGRLLAGKSQITKDLPALVEQGLQDAGAVKKDAGPVDLVKFFLSFTPLAVIGAGLIDGINPCAFTVIVFFVSFLTLQGYRRRELVAIGLVFIFAVFLTYLLLGLGLFSFLYSMSGFWAVRAAVNLVIGIMTIILGFLAVHDAVMFKRTGRTDQMHLQLPQAVKNQIHRVIGLHYRKQAGNARVSSGVLHIARLSVAALVTGFLVSLLEALCTGQVYVPTISFVLKTTQIRARAWMLLFLYNLMFILPLFVIFLSALFGVTSQHFSAFFKRRFLATKVALACVFFSLGLFLIWRG